MKKYKLICIGIILGYIFMWIFGNYMLIDRNRKKDSLYMVEVNRLFRQYVSGFSENSPNPENAMISDNEIRSYGDHIMEYQVENSRYVKYILYKPAEEAVTIEEEDGFYQVRSGYHSVIKPVAESGEITGYLRFDYLTEPSDYRLTVYYNLTMAALGLVCVLIFLYFYRHIIRPFHKLSDIPYELAKGNLTQDIKEEKGKYFGKFVWGIGMLKDTLEYHKQRELKLARDKKMILLSISHDIKTPLNAIELYAKALERNRYQSEEERKHAARKISEKVIEIDSFVQDIVKSSSEDIITLEIHNREFYTKDLIQKIQTGYGEKCRLNHIKFTIGMYDNLLLYGDVDRLYEAVGNLIENAFKYGDGIAIRITFAIEENYLLISVYNTGAPVEENEMAHLFDSFFRGKNAEHKQGNGLGLYICREIMKNMEGDIYAERCEEGMSFTIVAKISI